MRVGRVTFRYESLDGVLLRIAKAMLFEVIEKDHFDTCIDK